MVRQRTLRRGQPGNVLRIVMAALESEMGRAPDPLAEPTHQCPDENALAALAEGRGWDATEGSHVASCSRCAALVDAATDAWIRRPLTWWERNARVLRGGGRDPMVVRAGAVVRSQAAVLQLLQTAVERAVPYALEESETPAVLVASTKRPRGSRVPVFVLDLAGWVAGQTRARLVEAPQIEDGTLRVALRLSDPPAATAVWISVALDGETRAVVPGKMIGGRLLAVGTVPAWRGYSEIPATLIEAALVAVLRRERPARARRGH